MRHSENDLRVLESVSGGGYDRSVGARARIVLLRAEGMSVAAVASEVGVSGMTVRNWEARFKSGGIDALRDFPKCGAPRTVTGEQRSRIIALTRTSPPKVTGLSHWSARTMAVYLKSHEGISVSHNFVSQLWREHGLKPHRQGTFKVSRDPDFTEKVVNIVGLYLSPPVGAVVISVDEKTGIQALDRVQPVLPVAFDKTEKRTADYIRHGTTNLMAALNVLTGNVVGKCFDRRRTVEFLSFMDLVVAEHKKVPEIHVILDNLSTHKGEEVSRWLRKNPRVTFHYTPIGSSWLNQVEIWFGLITKQSIRRGTFVSVPHLIKEINSYIKNYNATAKPFTWVATAESILKKVTNLNRDFLKLVANNSNNETHITLH